MGIDERTIKEHRGYCYRIIFMKKNIFYHEKKYLSSWKKIILYVKRNGSPLFSTMRWEVLV